MPFIDPEQAASRPLPAAAIPAPSMARRVGVRMGECTSHGVDA
jgi:hypothetical protein